MQSPTSLETIAQSTAASTDAIPGIHEPVIWQYFETLNAGDFQATAELFAANGGLQPPFEAVIVGPAAIAAYLAQEARDLILQPQQGSAQLLEDGCTEFQVVGKVHTPVFSVNVSWKFILNPEKKLFLAQIKLLAALQELLNFRPQKAFN